MYNAHESAKSGQTRAQKIVEELKQEQALIELECIAVNQRVVQCVAELNNKALRVGGSGDEELYFNELIAQEKQERRQGYEQRIQQI